MSESPALPPPIVDLDFLAARWKCSAATARRTVARLGIPRAPVMQRGMRFRLAAVEAAECGFKLKPNRKAA